eukprot:94091-Pyramimonas_sp.AAC.1
MFELCLLPELDSKIDVCAASVLEMMMILLSLSLPRRASAAASACLGLSLPRPQPASARVQNMAQNCCSGSTKIT